MQFPIKIFYWVTYQQSAHTSHFSHLLIILLFNIYCYILYIHYILFSPMFNSVLQCLPRPYISYMQHYISYMQPKYAESGAT